MLLDHFRDRESLLIVGLMSGTSLDGIDVAFVEIGLPAENGPPELNIRHHATVPYASDLREHLLAACDGSMSLRDTFILDRRLGALYAEAIEYVAGDARIDMKEIDLIGMHGQTIWHDPRREPFGVTVQIGCAPLLSCKTDATVVHDFRSADVAASGEGAPLVPYVDAMLFRSGLKNLAVVNIGGIANVTWLSGTDDEIIAFDTGPGNALIDAAMRELRQVDYDENGRVAAMGTPDESLLTELLDDPWLKLSPPKSTGRELFGEERGRKLARAAKERGLADEDIVATLTQFTARTIVDATLNFAAKGGAVTEMIISGGGVKNRELMKMIGAQLPDTIVSTSDDHGIPSDAKESISFALLAWATIHGIPANVPSVTGASRRMILGSVFSPVPKPVR